MCSTIIVATLFCNAVLQCICRARCGQRVLPSALSQKRFSAHLETQDHWQLRHDERAIRDSFGYLLESLTGAKGVAICAISDRTQHSAGRLQRRVLYRAVSGSIPNGVRVTSGVSLAPSQQSISTWRQPLGARQKGNAQLSLARHRAHRVAVCTEPRTCSS